MTLPSLPAPEAELDESAVRARLARVFRFLRLQQEAKVPAPRNLGAYRWALDLSDLPEHPSVQRRPYNSEAPSPLLEVKRPTVPPAPAPPLELADWALDSWRNIEGPVAVAQSLATRNSAGDIHEVAFGEEAERVSALATWEAEWHAWQATALPAWEALGLYNRLFELHATLDREVGSVEAIVADANLVWRGAAAGAIDHPLLGRRVRVEFDASAPLVRIVDSPESPTEFMNRVLIGEGEVVDTALRSLQEALREAPIHPLDTERVETWARGAVQSLWSDGKFESTGAPSTDSRPVMGLRPLLVLRDRGQALAEVLAGVEDEINSGCDLPDSLVGIAGGRTSPRDAITSSHGTWATVAPPEVLFGKTANAEQLKLVQELERHDAILVQGPPGTGKSHTIANLIGHLTAQGKSVLVTSQKGKALRVLKGHLTEELQPLAVSVVAEEGSKPLQDAASALLAGMAQTPEELTERDLALTASRATIYASIQRHMDGVLRAVQGEYREISTGYGTVEPAAAAKMVAAGAGLSDWLPGPVQADSPCPLGEPDIARLYLLSSRIDPEVEMLVLAGLPENSDLLSVDEFTSLIRAERASAAEPETWGHGESDLPTTPTEVIAQKRSLVLLQNETEALLEELEQLPDWERRLVDVALRTEQTPDWLEPAGLCVQQWENLLAEERRLRSRHDVAISPNTDRLRLTTIVHKESLRLGDAGAIPAWRRLMNSDIKLITSSVLVDGHAPRSAQDLKVVCSALAVVAKREELGSEWRQLVREGPDLPEDEGACVALQQRLEHRAHLAERWRHLRASAGAAPGVNPDVLERRGPPVVETCPTLRVVITVLGQLRKSLQHRNTVLSAREATLLLAAAVAELEEKQAPLFLEAAQILRERDAAALDRFMTILNRLALQRADIAERQRLLASLAGAAPEWARVLSAFDSDHVSPEVPGPVHGAWQYRQIDQELRKRHGVDIERLQDELRTAQQALLAATRQLIHVRTWQHLLAGKLQNSKQDLLMYTQLMRTFGGGTGVLAQQILAEARKHLDKARSAVPIWVMPMDRVFESFRPKSMLFDVVIVDEASQCDLTGLLAYFIAKKVVVVGDHEQVQPSAVGMDLGRFDELRQSLLYDVPGSNLFRPDKSIYDFAQSSFGGQLMLREHFRCVPDIIAFSNRLSYDGNIRALRPASAAPLPHLVEHVVTRLSSGDPDKTNGAEIAWIAALIRAMTERAEYESSTIGVVSLLYDEQVKKLGATLIQHIPAELWARHRLDFGSPSQFQGDERDVMLLSMVSKPLSGGGPHRRLQERIFKSRFNVAASRARNQLWLVHSLDPAIDLQPTDYRAELISHVRDPAAVRKIYEEKARDAESPFELAVLKQLVDAGYDVRPQHQVGFYRIDMVVWDGDRRLAIECDGERFHRLEDLPKDLARQATLERLGWTFVRIRGSQWYRDREKTFQWLRSQLDKHEVHPVGRTVSLIGESHDGVRSLRVRARELLLEWGYDELVEALPEDSNDFAGPIESGE